VFRIERSGNTVRYYKGTTRLYVSTVPSYGKQILEASLYLGGDEVVHASLAATTTVGGAIGGATLLPVSSNGGDLPYGGNALLKALDSIGGIKYSRGTVTLLPITSAATGKVGSNGNARLLPVSALGGNKKFAQGDAVLRVINSSGTGYSAQVVAGGVTTGNAKLLPITSSAAGKMAQGGRAILKPILSLGGNKKFAQGGAVLAPLSSRAEAGTAPTYALGQALMSFIGSAGLGTTKHISVSPSKSLGDNRAAWVAGAWDGLTVYIVSGTGAGQSAVIALTTGQALLFNTAWVTVPDATSRYEVRSATGAILAAGNVTPGTSSLMPLNSLGSNYKYAGSKAVLKPLTAHGTFLIKLSVWAEITWLMATLVASARDATGENAANITAPSATVIGYMGTVARLTASMGTLVASATGTNWLTANVTAPMATLEATGTVAGTSEANITGLMASAVGYGGVVASVTLTGMPTVLASVTSGSVTRANIVGPMATLPLFEVRVESVMRADILAPMGEMGATLQAWVLAPMATLVAIGTATVAATYEAYAINLNHTPKPGVEPVDELTRYSNFPFTHIVRHQGSFFGVAADGLYLLEGTLDVATPIPWSVKTAMTDFKTPVQKTVASAYFGGRLGPAATVTLYAGEGAGVAYAYSTPRDTAPQNYRQVFGKGVKARYYSLGVSGTGTLELDNIELDTRDLTRRI